MLNIYCPLCKSEKSTNAFFIDEHELRTCDNCDLNFIHPYVQKEEGRNPLSVDKQFIAEQRAVNSYFRHISKYFKGSKSILDIGCGCGALLKRAEDFEIPRRNGVENDENRAAHASAYAGCEVFDQGFSELEVEKGYDLITLINVFSHIPDLDSFFVKTNSLLNENGKFIIKTGLFKKGCVKKVLVDWQIPEHIHFVGENTAAYIASRYHFKLVENIIIPIADELISKDYLLSPGLSRAKNLVKKVVYYFPGLALILRKLYTLHTKNKNFSNIIVFEKLVA